MVIHVASHTAFHVLDLARQLARRGHLGTYYTALPPSKTQGVPSEKVRRQPFVLLPIYMARKTRSERARQSLQRLAAKAFARWLATNVTVCDVFHCLSGFGLPAHRVARQHFGALTVCDRGSSHILYQEAMLREEYARWGIPYGGIEGFAKEMELLEYEECDLITVPSTFAWRSFVERGVSPEKLARIPLGVELSDFHPAPKKDRVFRVLYVGNLSIRKGIPYLLEALETLRLPDFELALIGSVTPEVERFLARYEGTFKYQGVQPRAELYRFYSQGSVLVVPSIEEGMAMVQAQAMACSVPVVATANTGAEDLFTDGVEGFIVPIRDPQAIREKVLALYHDPERQIEMGRAALKRVQSLGGWDSYGDCAAQAYANVLARRNGQAASAASAILQE